MHIPWKRFRERIIQIVFGNRLILKDPTQKNNSFTNRTLRIGTPPETEGYNEDFVLVNVTESWKTHNFNIYLSRIFLNTGAEVMKPAVDEMFPEGAGPYVDLDEVGVYTRCCSVR